MNRTSGQERSPRYHFLVRSWRAFSFFDRCIDSILRQRRKDYHILYVDDASGYTSAQKRHMRQKLTGHTVRFNNTRQYAVKNAYTMIHDLVTNDDAVIINVDGDDWLVRDDVIDIVEDAYTKTGCILTYGNCFYYEPGGPRHGRSATDVDAVTNRRYDRTIERHKRYRLHPFLPLHARTWKVGWYKRIGKRYFLRPDHSWIRFNDDQAILYPLLEMSAGRYTVIKDPFYVYNTATTYSDKRLHMSEKLYDEVWIRKMKPATP